jgi:thiosulfate dehydrogenase (quinone) large subunit
MAKIVTHNKIITDPPIARFLFSDTRLAIVWLAVRLYVGYQWLEAGFHKIQDPAWMVSGEGLRAFWVNVTKIPAAPAKPPISFDWYRSFLQLLLDANAYTWFGKVIAVGETAIGVALVLGAFVGVAAAAGAFMNLNFMLAGSASTNPVLFLLAILLVLAWKTAGFIGLDNVLLPLLGTPWHYTERHARAPTVAPPRPATV